MARNKNDGRGRMGGRAQGTPNKSTANFKEWLAELINKNRLQIEQDIKQLQPKERLQILERLMQYVIPKTPTIIEQNPTNIAGGMDEIRIGFSDDEN